MILHCVAQAWSAQKAWCLFFFFHFAIVLRRLFLFCLHSVFPSQRVSHSTVTPYSSSSSSTTLLALCLGSLTLLLWLCGGGQLVTFLEFLPAGHLTRGAQSDPSPCLQKQSGSCFSLWSQAKYKKKVMWASSLPSSPSFLLLRKEVISADCSSSLSFLGRLLSF